MTHETTAFNGPYTNDAIREAAQPVPEVRSEIAAQLNELTMIVETLWDDVRTLESHISPILRPPHDAADGAKPPIPLPADVSPIGDALRDRVQALTDLGALLRGLSDRVDL